MNTVEKEKQQKMIVQNLKGIEFAIKNAVTAKDAFRAKLNDLAMNGSKTWAAAEVENKIAKVKADILVKMTAANDGIAKSLEELRTLLHDRDSVLDLSNPALTNALSLIQTIGSSLSFEEAIGINQNFVHDQKGLRALKAAYSAHDVVSPGNIDGLIYNADETIDILKKLAFESFVQEGSINTFSEKLSKLAELEGTTVEELPDAQGATEAMRKAAGLPV